LEKFSILLNKLKEFSEKLKKFSEKTQGFSPKTQGFPKSTWFLLPKNVQKKEPDYITICFKQN